MVSDYVMLIASWTWFINVVFKNYFVYSIGTFKTSKKQQNWLGSKAKILKQEVSQMYKNANIEKLYLEEVYGTQIC